MAGLGRKTFSPGDVLTSSDVQNYLMDQSVMVFAGTAARASAIPSPSAGMVAYSTATALQVYNGSAWVDASLGYGVASGTAALSTAITVAGTAYTLLTFTADSNLGVSKAGLFDVLLVGGGGGGAGAVGGTGTALVGGAGGAGLDISSFVQTATTVAGGGGGQRQTGSSGAGGTGGGGAASNAGTGTPGTANTGGGGGGGATGAAGGSGVVYVRFKV